MNHNLCYIGALRRIKGIDKCIKVHRKLRRIYPDTRIKICGHNPNPKWRELNLLLREKGVESEG